MALNTSPAFQIIVAPLWMEESGTIYVTDIHMSIELLDSSRVSSEAESLSWNCCRNFRLTEISKQIEAKDAASMRHADEVKQEIDIAVNIPWYCVPSTSNSALDAHQRLCQVVFVNEFCPTTALS